MRTWCALVLGLSLPASTLLPAQDTRVRLPAPSDAAALIDAYAAGGDARIAAALNRDDALRSLRQALERIDFQHEDLAEQRFIAAGLAVEAAQYRGFREATAALEIIEWACGMLRTHDPPDERERLWHRAAIAIQQGLAEGLALEAHVEHASGRFPDEPHFALARAVAAELRTFPDPRASERLSLRIATTFDLLVTRLHRAAAYEPVRAEARLRLGYVHLRNDDAERALRQLDVVPVLTSEPFLVYLAHLFRGRALERTDRIDEAIAAYRDAVAVVPGAQSAVLALASALMRGQGRAEADELARAAVSSVPVADPWAGYGQGDLRLWPMIRRQMREAIR
jgi:tetratricopeptide (TPR) repeat protein